MLKRYLILLGARTTAGGTVKSVSSLMSCNGLYYALEGDPVDCPACGTEGVIQCAGPRLPASYNGRQYALEDDLCVCGCSPPPKLIANQDRNCQIVDGAAARHAEPAFSFRAPAGADPAGRRGQSAP